MELSTLRDHCAFVPAVPSFMLGAVRDQFLALMPVREGRHPLGCHDPRIADAVAVDRLVQAPVFGCGYERVADECCSAMTLRRPGRHGPHPARR